MNRKDDSIFIGQGMKELRKGLTVIALAAITVSCQNAQKPVDMLITNAKIWTGNEKQPRAEAMAVSGDTIVAVGTNREILRYRDAGTEVLDLEGRFIAPGFIDSHIHFYQGGANLASVQLRDASTPEEFIRRIREYAARQKPGTWILGGDWDGKSAGQGVD